MKVKLLKKKNKKVLLFVLAGENEHCHNRC